MKVIFLDIDGVMNSELFYRNRHKKRWFKLSTYKWLIISKTKFIFNGFKYKATSLADYKPKPRNYEYEFKRLKEETDKLKWEWLSEFCNENDYKICISSVWKNHFKDSSNWNNALIELGFNDNIFVGIIGERRTLRGTEIAEWVDKHNGEVENYAIIDDDSDMLPEQLTTCYFQVDGYYGLTPNHLYRINLHFKNEIKRLSQITRVFQ